jgi:4-amino-4-deoxy-L-arabinose transferase-like glycosyltransferase
LGTSVFFPIGVAQTNSLPMSLPSAPFLSPGPTRTAAARLWNSPLVAGLIALSYAAVLARPGGPRAAIEFDRDEGFSLMKAMLVNRGRSLYSEIWSDQPPGYTYLIAGFTRLCGETPEVARLISIFLASLTLASVYELCRAARGNLAGHLAGLSGALALVMSAGFVRFSVPVMVTLPSVAFAVLAWFLLARNRAPRRAKRALAGFVLGFGLAVKLIILPILPAFLLLFWRRGEKLMALARALLPFILGGSTALLLWFGPFLGQGLFESLIGAHIEGAREMRYSSVWSFYGQDAFLLALGALGAALHFRSRTAHFALAWLVLSTLALTSHAPIWEHHRLIITVPLAVLAGLGIGKLTGSSFSAPSPELLRASRAALASAALTFVAWGAQSGAARIAPALRDYQLPAAFLATERAVLEHAPHAKWAVTSNQTYAYRLGIPVPPNLAVTSSKRWQTGHLKNADVTDALRTYEPEVVILTNRWDKKLRRTLAKRELRSYRPVYQNRGARDLEVYVRADSKRP